MKRHILYPFLLLISICLLADYNPTTGTARIVFDISKLNTADFLTFPSDSSESQNRYLQVVWNTGDTGKSLVIDTPGIYICSVKDVILFDTLFQNYNRRDPYWMSPVLIRGLPDTVIIDTLMVTDTDGAITDNFRTIRQFTLNKRGHFVTETYRDTSWASATNDTMWWTESVPHYLGFWSGVIDSIVITERNLPVLLNTRLLINGKEMLINRKWDASY
ncbi:MAG: hypothetical protein JXQ80_12215 [Bacteroidales bacterium]|nr:hypothetical protein [Bacteroidales bacterium]